MQLFISAETVLGCVTVQHTLSQENQKYSMYHMVDKLWWWMIIWHDMTWHEMWMDDHKMVAEENTTSSCDRAAGQQPVHAGFEAQEEAARLGSGIRLCSGVKAMETTTI